MNLTEEQVRKLSIGKVLYYNEYDPGAEKVTWDDIVQVVGYTIYSGPKFKVLFSKINEIGEEASADIYEITNGRAKAMDDTDFIIKLIFERELQ